jgi:hypothetical protein
MNTPTEQTPVDLEGLRDRQDGIGGISAFCGPVSFIQDDEEKILTMEEMVTLADVYNAFPAIDHALTTARQRVAELEREVKEAKFMPLGDNHHNALKCPYCNPDQIDPKALRATITSQSAEIERLRKALRGADEALASTYWTSDNGENIRDSEPDESGASPYVIERWKALRTLTPPPQGEEVPVGEAEKTYPCDECGALRTKAQGGTTFTVCDDCWDKHRPEAPSTSEAEVGGK